jgi:hypothetical protein
VETQHLRSPLVANPIRVEVPSPFDPLKMLFQPSDFEWVAQVSLLSKLYSCGKWRLEGTSFWTLSPSLQPGAPHLPGFGRCGIPQAFPSHLLRTTQLRTSALRSHQRCPDFRLRGTNHNRACGFLSKNAARSCSRPRTSTGNPGYVGRKRWAKPFDSLSFQNLRFVP